MSTVSSNGINLRVAEAISSDIRRDLVGRGLVRIDTNAMKQISISTGDIVAIQGKKKTGAIAIPSRPEDKGRGLIRMDGLVRSNAGTSIGENVQVTKISRILPAKSIAVAPADPNLRLSGSGEHIRKVLTNRPVTAGDILSINAPIRRQPMHMPADIGEFFDRFANMPHYALGEVRLVVVSTNPSGIVQIEQNTKVEIRPPSPQITAGVGAVTYEDVGGLSEELVRVREMIELPMRHPELFERLGIEPPKGILLHGPPGTGKTLIARAVANESGANFIPIAGPEIMSKFYGESEQKLRSLFEDAEKNAPTIIFIDEIDSIAPKREEVTGEVERRVVAQLLALMDGLKTRGKVIVLAATNRPNALDPALRRPGRFDREIELGVPDRNGRREILGIHTRGMPLAPDVNLDSIADKTHGFVGTDIAALTKEAAMFALRRILPEIELEEDEMINPEVLEKLAVDGQDFNSALKLIEPSALREVLIQIPQVSWDDIGGLEETKALLKEAVEWPIKYPNAFKESGVRPPTGVLLYGPPGTGKTLLAKAVANESEANFIAIRGPEVLSKWVGESERAVREVFRKARQATPSIIFLDEIDSIAPRRGTRIGSSVTDTIVNQLLTLIDGIEETQGLVLLGATNRPELLDPALLRAGRFDRLILVNAPDEKARLAIFKVHTKMMNLASDVNLVTLAKHTEGYVGADIANICMEAVLTSLRKDIQSRLVTHTDFETAMKHVRPSVNEEVTREYEKISSRILGKEVIRKAMEEFAEYL
ncbi:MAG: CDC48 family AAA ATPase [Promethearchaeota archaeon]